MAEKALPHIKRNSNDKKHRIFEVIQSIKDAILKRKYNQAWDHAAKYYEQNKSSLKNEEIYQLCWLSCQSINKKVNIRLTASPKSYLPPLTDNHLNHLYSLYLSLHLMILPQVTNKDRKYFDMLSTSENLINPKSISPHDLVFQRKPSSFFLQKEQINKELKKLVKQHLRIVNNTLMYKVKTRKSHEDVIEAIKYAQEIFDSFKEHEFPVESINFQLIKLSLMEDLGIKQGIKCEYRLPIELINKIYSHLRSKKDEALQHYIKKLSSYLVLSFRNLPMKIEDIYIICQQILFLTRILHQISAPPSLQNPQSKKKFPLLKLNRQITIQKDPVEEETMYRSGKSKISSSFSTNNKLSQKKLQSKTRIHKPEGQLKNIALSALQKINLHLAGRKEVNHIIMSYFPQSFFKNLKNDPSDQIIESQVPLQISRKNRKNGTFQQRNEEEGQQKCKRKNHRSLTSLINRKGFQKKIQTYEEASQKQTVLTNTMNKKKAKFITRNIQLIKKDSQIDVHMSRKLQKVISSIGGEVEYIDESSSDQQGNMKRIFERERRKEIKSANCKYQNKKTLDSTANSGQKLVNQKQSDEDSVSEGLNDQERVRSISLLDDVVNSVVNNLLQLPSKTGNNHSKRSIVQKLQRLKCEVQSLNLQRDLLVDRLTKRKNSDLIDRSNLNDREQRESEIAIKQDKFISDFYEKTKQKMAQHIALNTKLINLQKENKFKMNSQPKIKLKLDKQYKKMPEITYASLQEQYKRVQGCIQNKREVWDMVLSCQYDKLRRDVAKNQFASQNQKKNSNKKGKCETIIQNTLQEDNS